MNLRELPVVRTVSESGADDRVFDSLLLVGPVLVVSIAVFGRSVLTVALAAGYISVFLVYVLYQAFGG